MNTRSLFALLPLVLSGLLTACGGGSTNTNATLSGSVIDGYIEGATVCLDVNGNGKCDADEPQSPTDSSGHYRFDSGQSNPSGYLLVDVPSTAKDSDDNGQTLQQVGKSAYTMATPASRPQVITPLTTMVVAKMKSEGKNLSDAQAAVRNELGLAEGTDLHEDHIKADLPDVQDKARTVALLLQEVRKSQTQGNNDPLKDLSDKIKTETEALGVVVGTPSALTLPNDLSTLATAKLLTYKMVNVKGKPISATAILFEPKGTLPEPDGGRRLIVFGHGTTGIDTQCAPSLNSAHYAYASLIKTLLQSGLVVVAPDYEGRGPAATGTLNAHPYLHLGSAGNAMVLAAVAAKKHLGAGLNGEWVAMGHSQGGHAALGAAQFASLGQRLVPSLNYKGALAIAPASNFHAAIDGLKRKAAGQTDTATAVTYLGGLAAYSTMAVKGSSFTTKPIPPEEVIGNDFMTAYDKAGTECLGPYFDTIGTTLTNLLAGGKTPATIEVIKPNALTNPAFVNALRMMEPGTVKLPGKTVVLQGSADTTVIPELSRRLVDDMKAKGSDATYNLVNDSTATHTAVLATTAGQQAIASFICTTLSSLCP